MSNDTPSIIRTIPIMIAIYTGWLIANIARAIAMIPITNTRIELNVDMRVKFENSPAIPKTIMMNPTI